MVVQGHSSGIIVAIDDIVGDIVVGNVIFTVIVGHAFHAVSVQLEC